LDEVNSNVMSYISKLDHMCFIPLIHSFIVLQNWNEGTDPGKFVHEDLGNYLNVLVNLIRIL